MVIVITLNAHIPTGATTVGSHIKQNSADHQAVNEDKVLAVPSIHDFL